MQFNILDLGLIDFRQAWQIQKDILQRAQYGNLPPTVILCRHLPVITLGRLAKTNNILKAKGELGLPVYRIERGGDVTYHGPGQLTAYPIFNLNRFKKDLHWFLRQLEEVITAFCLDLGIYVESKEGTTGIWLNDCKVASIGISVKSWITYHGLSINIKSNDLANFSLIRPCGMDIKMTALESIRGRSWEFGALTKKIVKSFNKVFEFERNNYLGGKI